MFFLSFSPLFLSIARRLTLQLQTFCGEKKVIHYSSQSAFVFLWIRKYGGRVLLLFRACSCISTLSKMFAALSRRITKLFSLQQNFTSNLAFFHACPRCFILLLECFLICFSDHLWRKHLHTSRNFMHFANNSTDPVWWLEEKQLCGFQQYTNPSCLYTIYFITTSAWPQVYFYYCTGNPLQFRVQYKHNLFYTHHHHIRFTTEPKKPVWFRIQCKQLDYMWAFVSTQSWFYLISELVFVSVFIHTVCQCFAMDCMHVCVFCVSFWQCVQTVKECSIPGAVCFISQRYIAKVMS